MERSTDEAVGHPPEGAAAIEAVPRTAPHPRKRKRMAARTANENGQRVVLDFGWWDFMNEEERRSLKSQIKDAYGATLSAKKPLRLVLCSMSEPVFAALATIGGFESWSCDKLSATLDQVALDSGRYVVLSPDAEDVLTSFEEGTVRETQRAAAKQWLMASNARPRRTLSTRSSTINLYRGQVRRRPKHGVCRRHDWLFQNSWSRGVGRCWRSTTSCAYCNH